MLGTILGFAISFCAVGLLITSLNERVAHFLLNLSALIAAFGLLRFSFVYKKTMRYNSEQEFISDITYSRANKLIIMSIGVITFLSSIMVLGFLSQFIIYS